MAYTPKGTYNDNDLPEDAKRLIAQYKQAYADASAKGDTLGMAAAHSAAERLRINYGYSGGGDGSEYLPLSASGGQIMPDETKPIGAKPKSAQVDVAPDFSYTAERPQLQTPQTQRPTYESPYTPQMDAKLDQILSRAGFSFDENSPLVGSYNKTYRREGQRAISDTLGQAAAANGGMLSTAAMNAATQAGDYYASKMADAIPMLYDQALSEYYQGLAAQRADLQDLQSMEDMAFRQYLQNNANWENDRDFSYQKWLADNGLYDTDYNNAFDLWRSQVVDAQYQQEMDWAKMQDALDRTEAADQRQYEQQLALADMMGAAGDFSRYGDLGLTPQEQALLSSYYQQQMSQAASSGSRSSGGSSGGSGGSRSSSTGGGDDLGGGSIFEQMQAAGVPQDEGQAYAWLRSQGVGTTDANRYAKYYASMVAEEETEPAGVQHPTGTESIPGLQPYEFMDLQRQIQFQLDNGFDEIALQTLGANQYRLSDKQWNQLKKLIGG